MTESLAHRGAAAVCVPKRYVALALLAAAQVAFAFVCSPLGVRSGQWAVPGLSDPDCLVFAAAGATLIFPMLIYPGWAVFGPGDARRRFAATAILSIAFVGASCVRGWFRGWSESLAISTVFVLTHFTAISSALWLLRRLWGRPRRVVNVLAESTSSPPIRPQFGLRGVFRGITVAACALALYRFYFPEGIPPPLLERWWAEIVRAGRSGPFLVLLLLPAAYVPWRILAAGAGEIRGPLLAIACLAALDAVAVGLGGALGLFFRIGQTSQGVAALQMGATAAGLTSAIALRRYGYRLLPETS